MRCNGNNEKSKLDVMTFNYMLVKSIVRCEDDRLIYRSFPTNNLEHFELFFSSKRVLVNGIEFSAIGFTDVMQFSLEREKLLNQ